MWGMIALTRTDKCYSTISSSLGRVFNTDGKRRDKIDIQQARSAFDFEIVKKPSFDENLRKIPGHFHIVRSDNGAFIPSSGLGKKFVPIQHKDIFDSVVNEIIPLANDVLKTLPKLELETVGTLHGGGTGIVTVRVGEPFRIEGDSSACYFRLVFSNPCNGRGSIIIGCTIVRDMCQNQIPVACGGFSVHHTKNANIHLSNAMKCVVEQVKEAETVKGQVVQMASTFIRDDDEMSFIDAMIDQIYPLTHKQGTQGYKRQFNVRAEVRTQFYGGDVAMSIKGDTAWKVYNAFTYPIFNPVSIGKNMDYADILYSSMVGGKRHLLRRIFNTINSEYQRFRIQ